jgi:hypothetical protein
MDVLDVDNEFLSTVLCHKLKELVRYGKFCGKPYKGSCWGYPMYLVVCRENLPNLLIKLPSRICRFDWGWTKFKPWKKESRSKNEVSFLFCKGKKTCTQFFSLTGALSNLLLHDKVAYLFQEFITWYPSLSSKTVFVDVEFFYLQNTFILFSKRLIRMEKWWRLNMWIESVVSGVETIIVDWRMSSIIHSTSIWGRISGYSENFNIFTPEMSDTGILLFKTCCRLKIREGKKMSRYNYDE